MLRRPKKSNRRWRSTPVPNLTWASSTIRTITRAPKGSAILDPSDRHRNLRPLLRRSNRLWLLNRGLRLRLLPPPPSSSFNLRLPRSPLNKVGRGSRTVPSFNNYETVKTNLQQAKNRVQRPARSCFLRALRRSRSLFHCFFTTVNGFFSLVWPWINIFIFYHSLRFSANLLNWVVKTERRVPDRYLTNKKKKVAKNVSKCKNGKKKLMTGRKGNILFGRNAPYIIFFSAILTIRP